MKALLALEDGRIFPCRSFTGPENIDRAEDRDLFQAMLDKLGLCQPEKEGSFC